MYLCKTDLFEIELFICIKIDLALNNLPMIDTPYKEVKMATVVEGDKKAPLLITSTPRCRGGCYSFPWTAPLCPWYVPYNAEC